MWFARSVATRLARAVLRCFPILIVAAFIPQPYGIDTPASLPHFLLFVLSLILGLAVTVTFCLLVYVLAFFTISPQGLRIVFISCVEFFSGAVIPLPFFPDAVRSIMELLPLHPCRMPHCGYTAPASAQMKSGGQLSCKDSGLWFSLLPENYYAGLP